MDKLNFISEKTIEGQVYILKRDPKSPKDTYLEKNGETVLFDSKKWGNNEMIKAAF